MAARVLLTICLICEAGWWLLGSHGSSYTRDGLVSELTQPLRMYT